MFCFTSKVEKAIFKNIKEANKCPDPNDRWNRLHTMSDVVMSLYEAKAIGIDAYENYMEHLSLMKSTARLAKVTATLDGITAKMKKSNAQLEKMTGRRK